MNPALADEILSINAIYTPETLTQVEGHDDIFILRIPSCDVSLRLSFSPDYPDSPPIVIGSESSGSQSRKGEASEVVSVARQILGTCFRPGEPCIYDLLEELVQILESRPHEDSRLDIPETQDEDDVLAVQQQPSHVMITAPPWILSEPVTEKKSVFLARAVRAGSVEEAQSFIEHLVTTDKRAARATHNISAWRIRDVSKDLSFQDSDDDGETAAGGRLLHLLQVMDAWNVVVVVSRWYGGIHLGPDRFRIINSVARDALTKGNFASSGKDSSQHIGKR